MILYLLFWGVSMREITNFKRDEKRNITVDYDSLAEKKESLEDFVVNEPLINKSIFTESSFPQEIKSNNSIEGIDDAMSEIDQLASRLFVSVNRDKNRILNLYNGYSYILKNKEINKESLKELYNILSNGLLPTEYKKRMGEFYREGPVYIIRGFSEDRYFQGTDHKKIDEYMDILFDYINNNNFDNNEIDSFIKSQIIHCYCVYIHPYFDVNGRTSRTLGMWYLLNKKAYNYMTFNRSISFIKSKYEKSLIALREKGDMTYFLKYILDAEKLELEKEYIINDIEKNIGEKLSNEEYLMLEYFLSLNGQVTLLDWINLYNEFNQKRKKNIIYEDNIKPLVEKGIIKETTPTKHSVVSGLTNKRLVLNQDMIDVNQKKIKILNLSHFTKNVQD